MMVIKKPKKRGESVANIASLLRSWLPTQIPEIRENNCKIFTENAPEVYPNLCIEIINTSISTNSYISEIDAYIQFLVRSGDYNTGDLIGNKIFRLLDKKYEFRLTSGEEFVDIMYSKMQQMPTLISKPNQGDARNLFTWSFNVSLMIRDCNN